MRKSENHLIKRDKNERINQYKGKTKKWLSHKAI